MKPEAFAHETTKAVPFHGVSVTTADGNREARMFEGIRGVEKHPVPGHELFRNATEVQELRLMN